MDNIDNYRKMFLKQSSWQCFFHCLLNLLRQWDASLWEEFFDQRFTTLLEGSQVHWILPQNPMSAMCLSKKTAHFFGGRAKIVIRTYMFSLWMRHNISPKNQKIRSWSWHCKDFWALFGSASTCKRMRKPQPDKRTEETMSMTRRKANLVKHGDLPPKTGKSLDFEVT